VPHHIHPTELERGQQEQKENWRGEGELDRGSAPAAASNAAEL
jgi:hypothetical protein